MGWFWLFLLILFFGIIGTLLIALTVVGAARAWRNQDVLWVVAIVGAWAFGLGWAAALFYVVGIDPQRKATGPPPGLSPPGGT